MTLRRILPLLVILLAVGGFIALKASRPSPPPVQARERSWHVDVAPIELGPARPTLVLYGRVEAPDQMRAAAPVAGRVLELKVRDGDRVEAGSVLARLDPRDLEPRLVQARAEIERERIRHLHDRAAVDQERVLLELAESRRARLEKLKNARLGAESALDQAREEVARARLALSQREQSLAEHPARLAQLESRLGEARRDAQRGEITAPFAARIAAVEVAAGNQVQAGQTLMTLYSSSELFLRARVPVEHAEELRLALARGERLEARATFGTATMAARLERISGNADARGVDALLRLLDTGAIPVGAFLNAVLERPAVDRVLSVPFSALHGGDRVYLAREGRLASVRVERVGERRDGDQVLLLLRAAEFDNGGQIMTTHLPNAVDGLAVEVLTR